MTLLAVLAVECALAALLIGAGAFTRGRREVHASLARVGAYARPAAADAPAAVGKQARSASTLVLARVGVAFTSRRGRDAASARLHAAGLRPLRLDTYLAAKGGLSLGGLALGVVLAAAAPSSSPALGLVLALVLGALAFVLPDAALAARARRRRERVLRELPNALDLLAVSVEAGLGLDGALARYAATARGPLAEELALIVAELRVGGARGDVLRRLSERVPAPETRTFVRGLVHAEKLGTSLGATLRTQAAEVRVRRRAVAEEKANRMPVQMLFPTVFCIFPALFVVVLGPPVLQLIHTL